MYKNSNAEFVCAACFSDEGLQEFCSNHAESEECDFCGATDAQPIAAPLDDAIEHINSCIHMQYDDPGNAGLPYETAEGGWQGETYSTDEIFAELNLDFPQDKNDQLREAISNGLDTDLWCEAEPFLLTPDQQLHFSWKEFCRLIKHERRYFFLQSKKKESDDEELFGPAQILKKIFEFAEGAGAFVKLAANTALYRARYQSEGQTYLTAATLGPPPLEHAIQTNRMSPPGIVMMYVAEDQETALAETADKSGRFALGTFVSERDILILDLTRLPLPPSVFAELPDTYEYDPRPRLNFLHSISHDISRPIVRDDRVHIEYVPTQVVTEYVRTAIQIKGQKIEGIRYNSSRRKAQTALVLFADQKNLVLSEAERPNFYHLDDRWIRLISANQVKVTKKNLVQWAAQPRRTLFDDA